MVSRCRPLDPTLRANPFPEVRCVRGAGARRAKTPHPVGSGREKDSLRSSQGLPLGRGRTLS